MSSAIGGWNAHDDVIYNQNDNFVVCPCKITIKNPDAAKQGVIPSTVKSGAKKIVELLNKSIEQSVKLKKEKLMAGETVEIFRAPHLYTISPVTEESSSVLSKIRKFFGGGVKIRLARPTTAPPTANEQRVGQAVKMLTARNWERLENYIVYRSGYTVGHPCKVTNDGKEVKDPAILDKIGKKLLIADKRFDALKQNTPVTIKVEDTLYKISPIKMSDMKKSTFKELSKAITERQNTLRAEDSKIEAAVLTKKHTPLSIRPNAPKEKPRDPNAPPPLPPLPPFRGKT